MAIGVIPAEELEALTIDPEITDLHPVVVRSHEGVSEPPPNEYDKSSTRVKTLYEIAYRIHPEDKKLQDFARKFFDQDPNKVSYTNAPHTKPVKLSEIQDIEDSKSPYSS